MLTVQTPQCQTKLSYECKLPGKKEDMANVPLRPLWEQQLTLPNRPNASPDLLFIHVSADQISTSALSQAAKTRNFMMKNSNTD